MNSLPLFFNSFNYYSRVHNYPDELVINKFDTWMDQHVSFKIKDYMAGDHCQKYTLYNIQYLVVRWSTGSTSSWGRGIRHEVNWGTLSLHDGDEVDEHSSRSTHQNMTDDFNTGKSVSIEVRLMIAGLIGPKLNWTEDRCIQIQWNYTILQSPGVNHSDIASVFHEYYIVFNFSW